MKSKAPLSLIELAVGILIFAISAAVCISVFVRADRISRESALRDRALLHAENVAEAVSFCAGDLSGAARLLGGSYDGTQLTVAYDENWNTENAQVEKASYLLVITEEESNVPGLGCAGIRVENRPEGRELVSFRTGWQKALEAK